MKNQKSKKTRIILSILALVEVVALVAGVTFSWVEGGKKAYVNGNDLQVSTGSGITMFKDGKSTNSISLPLCELAETSSADGRNFFFPMADTESNDTSTMTFREGTASDRNKKYLSMDFQLVAGSADAYVYLGAGTIIQCSDKDINQALLSALRMSFYTNDGKTPIVFKPNQMPGVTEGITYSPITSISNSGAVTKRTETSTEAYGDYYYSGEGSNSLFYLKKGETKNITLSIWLEGTEFSGNDIAEKPLSIYIDFTTQLDDLVRYNFVDNTHGYGGKDKEGVIHTPDVEHWITNEPPGGNYDTMMYIYDNSTDRYYTMKKSKDYDNDYTWIGYVPTTINNFYFRRYSIDIDTYWNEWVPSMSNIPKYNNQYTYVAICGTAVQDSDWKNNVTPCGGYWKDSDGTFRVYFENSVKWSNPHYYIWSGESKVEGTADYPGTLMTNYHTNSYGNKVYYVDLKESYNLSGIIFNNGKTGSGEEKYEIGDTQFLFNGFAAWYKSSSSKGMYLYTGTENSLIFN